MLELLLVAYIFPNIYKCIFIFSYRTTNRCQMMNEKHKKYVWRREKRVGVRNKQADRKIRRKNYLTIEEMN